VNPTELAIDALAVHRLTHLIQEDEVWPVKEIRDFYVLSTGQSRWSDLASCPWCAGMWLAALVALLRWRFPRAWPVAAKVLAGSTVAGLLAEWTHR
jgi:hypothetical protein